MATHSSILAWEISWTEEPGRLQPMGPQSVRHDLVTKQQDEGQGTGEGECSLDGSYRMQGTSTCLSLLTCLS